MVDSEFLFRLFGGVIGAVIGTVLGLAIAVLVGGLLLRASCWLYNGCVGRPASPRAVHLPGLLAAGGIVWLAGFLGAVLHFAFGLLASEASEATGNGAAIVLLPVSLLANFILFSALTKMLLTTTVGRAALVVLAYYLITTLVVVGVVVNLVL